MYDKTVRRRRAVLGLLVACSLILLTAYFGESAGGGLHSLQRGVLQVVSPIQEGASRALKPFRDFFGWAGDTLHAKGKVSDLTKQRNDLRNQLLTERTAEHQNAILRNLLDLDNSGFKQYDPVTSRVIGYSPTVWYSTVNIDKGTSAGIHLDQPVIGADEDNGALIGKVTFVTGDAAQVTLITDHTLKVGGRVLPQPKVSPPRAHPLAAAGTVQTGVGRPNDLILYWTTRNDDIRRGDAIVTSGTCSDRFESPFPPDVPIGEVTRVTDPGTDEQLVHLRPYVNMRRLQFVQVLTKRVNGNRGGPCPH